jgi:hypothetical protein
MMRLTLPWFGSTKQLAAPESLEVAAGRSPRQPWAAKSARRL